MWRGLGREAADGRKMNSLKENRQGTGETVRCAGTLHFPVGRRTDHGSGSVLDYPNMDP
jgi:hypothetical protein